MKTKETKNQAVKMENASCSSEKCPIHGRLKIRGRQFKGYITKKFPKRIVIEFDRVIYIPKYERYMKKKTRIHANLPDCKQNEVNLGDYVLVQECRPLSKIIHFVYIRKVRDSGIEQGEKK